MKKLVFVALLGVILSTPFFAQAAWWNPTTWSWGSGEAPIEAIQEGTVNVDIPSTTDTELPPEPTEPNVVIKYVTDPALSLQVQELIKENEALTNQIASLNSEKNTTTQSLNLCTAQLSKTSTKNERVLTGGGVGGAVVDDRVVTPCDQWREKNYNSDKKILSLQNDMTEELETAARLRNGGVKTQETSDAYIKSRYDALIKEINTAKKSAQVEIDYYCK